MLNRAIYKMKIMFQKITFLISILFCIVLNTESQTIENTESKSFLIIQSTKSYNRALKKAQLACNDLSFTLNLRNLFRDKTNGLTTNEVCGCGEKHGYIARGRYDDGEYISIEYSSSYEAFAPNYYIVVVASGKRTELNDLLPKIREEYPDAYIKESSVYVGCMH